jgi:probable rRNA maturation factor
MIDIEIEDPAWSEALPNAGQLALEAAEAATAEGGLTILLTDDAAVAELNLRFRDKAGPTNVLSFPAPANPENHLGDIALAYGVCAREAVEQGKPLAHHLQHLVAHGVLHLVGYDHQTETEAEEMEALERRILAGLGIPDPYA